MNHYTESVKKFHESFNHPIEDEIKEDNIKLRKLRLKLLFEEIAELSHAMGTDDTLAELCNSVLHSDKFNNTEYDKVETIDALCDIQYVLSGAVLALGYKDIFDDAFDEVQRSNMSKMCENTSQAEDTIKYYQEERGELLSMEIVEKDGKYIVVRSDGKIMKNVHYSPANLNQFIDE